MSTEQWNPPELTGVSRRTSPVRTRGQAPRPGMPARHLVAAEISATYTAAAYVRERVEAVARADRPVGVGA